MAHRTTYTAEKKTLKKYSKLLEKWGRPAYDLPLRRTDRRYRRRCSTCCRFLAREVKGAYCRTCNAERRRRDRQEAAYERGKNEYFDKAYSRWGSTALDVLTYFQRDDSL